MVAPARSRQKLTRQLRICFAARGAILGAAASRTPSADVHEVRVAAGLVVSGSPAYGSSIPCMASQLTKALNQPVLVVSLGYMPKP